MTKEEHRQYAREYRADGFGRVNDKSYYMRNQEKRREYARARYALRKLSRENQPK